ncbi:MAG: Na/Pi cotransporter family protein [Bacteroidales bacterium]|nr:Na/Pi cotransporter family protein [Bacteroidales bacterium]
MSSLILILSLLGGIALCLYGMKVMSQGILKVAGSRMRASLRHISHNRLSSFWTGAWITSIIQSSSAMTIMTVGLVNAGLLSVSQSIALMMGANVGTTLSAWIIATFGFFWNARYLAIPLVVVALPLMYSHLVKARPWGEMLMGVALYILGFTTFIAMMPAPDAEPAAAQLFATLSSWGYWSIFIFVIIGILITVILRSSAAVILLAMALVAKEWLIFPMAAALVIGVNVGTTLTALFATRRTNVSARRSAYSHVLFNLFGMCWALILIYPISEVTWQFVSFGTGFPSPAALAFGIAIFHTSFNFVTALLLIGFIPQIKALVARLLPFVEEDEEELTLQFIQSGLLSTAELSIEEARKETALFAVRCQRMMQLTDDFMRMAADNPQYSHTFSRIEKYEKITDRLELEIVRYLNSLDTSSISGQTAARVRALLRIVDELESIGDACYKLACLVERKNEHKVAFIPMQQQNIGKMLLLVKQALEQMTSLLKKPEMTEADMQRAYNQEDAINALRGQLRELNIASVQNNDYNYQSGMLYMDIINAFEKIGDYVINVLEAHAEPSNFEQHA